MKESHVSSPASTGGAGTFFEQHVGAYWLALLLVRAIPPIFVDAHVAQVHFQTKRLGWCTDDFLIEFHKPDGAVRKLAGQVKRKLTISAKDPECKQAFQNLWKDFIAPERFTSDDRLALVVLRGTDALLGHFSALLDCARAARDPAEFVQRLETTGFVSKDIVRYCDVIAEIIGQLEARPVTQNEMWPFLRALHVLSLDLLTSTRQAEAHICALLAYGSKEENPFAAARACWNELLVIASEAMSQGRSLARDDLPIDLRNRHHPIASTEESVLRALRDHTAIVLDGIGLTIGGDLHLSRAGLIQTVLTELGTAQVVVVTGPAGTGKSAIAKEAIELLASDHIVLGFRAEEFAQVHLDSTLHAAKIPVNTSALLAVLGAQDKKVLLVESVERLLERATRDAFSDLMALAAKDPTLRIILSCRDYSCEQVKASFLQPATLRHATVHVPPLDDSELSQVETARPELVRPLSHAPLRRILRNPYFLDKALQIVWYEERSIPENERELRALFWSQIVRADAQSAPGLSRRREQVFEEVAVRRARALAPHVACGDLDPEVLERLQRDSLVVVSRDSPLLVAPAHDVLEDWAILRWIEERWLTGEASLTMLCEAIGPHPAMRRAYRKWVAELLDQDPGASDRLFLDAVSETAISAHFRDDTIVALLRAQSSPDLLMRHVQELIAHDSDLLKRVIHLLRVACVTTADWTSGLGVRGSVFNVPEGPAWATVLTVVNDHLDQFKEEDRLLLLGLIEDAVRNVSWWNPDVAAAHSIAGIGHWLLPGFDHYDAEKPLDRLLQVLAKIPKGDPTGFEEILRGSVEGHRRRNRIAESLQELIFAGMDGMPTSRDLPNVLLSVAEVYLLASDDDVRGRYDFHAHEMELYFGIDDKRGFGHFPASGIRGPWLPLLSYHHSKAIDFYIKVFNHSVEWYIEPRIPNRLEPAWEVVLKFSDGAETKQYANPRLWNLYRGTSVGPYVLQSMLMALEKRLLEIAEHYPDRLDTILVDVLRRSMSAALSAVVASIATAHPHSSVETLLGLLSAPDYISLDRGRAATERGTSIMERLPQFGAGNRGFNQERSAADRLPHRSHDLEWAILNLQLGNEQARVHSVLDRHLSELPPLAEQDESHRLWRLAIHRMDLRQYETSHVEVTEPGSDADDPATAKHVVRFDPKSPDPDIQDMVEESATEFQKHNARLAVWMWGLRIFDRDHDRYDPAEWRQQLAIAQSLDRDVEIEDGTSSGPGLLAAVCIRDHWNEMDAQQQDWCIDVACSEVRQLRAGADNFDRVQRNPMAANRACAAVLALLVGRALSVEHQELVQSAFAVALLHRVDEVREYAISYIDSDFWAKQRAVALRAVNAMATEATMVDRVYRTMRQLPYDERQDPDELARSATKTVTDAFWATNGIAEDAYGQLDLTSWAAASANVRILAMLRQVPTEEIAVQAFKRSAADLVENWSERRSTTHTRERNFHTEAEISQQLQYFLMRTSPEIAKVVLAPVLEAVDEHPRELHSIVQGLTAIEDASPNTDQYWFVWRLFAEHIRGARWIARLDGEHPWGSDLLSAIFLTSFWKEEVRHWKSLAGHANNVDQLFEALPATAIVLECYVRFLYHVGDRSLPQAFVRIAKAIESGDARAMLKGGDTIFMLEVLLQRHVYGRPAELKAQADVRLAVLHLLDVLVEAGSSAAFRMRDDFVTPSA